MTRRLSPAATAYISRLASRLVAAGYTREALQRRLSVTSPDDVGVLNHPAALQRVADDTTSAAAAVRLFFLEADEPQRRAAAMLSRLHGDDLIRIGLLQRVRGQLRARARIDPMGDQYVIADRRFRGMDPQALQLPLGDPVYPPSSDSLLLRDVVAASSVQRALDLCTGSGIQALQVAPRADTVVAVDINPRAAALASLNAQLNGLGNVDVRVGDLYAPVRGEQFDLIIANPPFVASPYAAAPSYHSGGPTGDRVLRRIISGFGKHLRPGGRAFAITHLALREREQLHTVARSWFRRFPGRALVLVLETGTPVDLAAAQSLFALDGGLQTYAAEVQRWVRYLRRHRIRSITLLLIVAERSARRGIEVIDAHPRVLPIPLSPPPAQRIAAWLA